ncbi:MAG TPA: isochorismatase family cysteine hydrolase [Mobilitalea sp.]|nr:isochorismatase family cysteine hydrolase [Mobilitalea sp.]
MKKVLIVIDMQNDFIDGALGTKEAIAIVPNVKKKIEEYKKAGHTVIFTRDTHDKDYLQSQEGKNLPVKHCIKGTGGWAISPQLDTSDSIIFDKGTFGSVSLMSYLSENYKDAEFEIIGLCTDICVISNALMLKAFLPEAVITVDASCCAGVTPQSHKNALEAMKMCHIKIINE